VCPASGAIYFAISAFVATTIALPFLFDRIMVQRAGPTLAVLVFLGVVDHDWQLRYWAAAFLAEPRDLSAGTSGRLHRGLVETGITANYMRRSPGQPVAPQVVLVTR
jgi:hypothetical protein